MRHRSITCGTRPPRAIADSDLNVAGNTRPPRVIVAEDHCSLGNAQSHQAISARSLFRALIASVLLLALTGCLSLGGDSKVVVYSPQVKIEAKPEWPSVAWQLVINKPLASEALDSSGIAVRPAPGELQVYADAQWADTAPDMLQTVLVQGFEDSGKIASVGRQGAGLHGDFLLLLDMRQFESVYADPSRPPSAVIEMQAKLLAIPSSRVLAARTFRVSVPARDKEVPQVVDAFQGAMTDLVGQVVGWTLANGQANAKPPTTTH